MVWNIFYVVICKFLWSVSSSVCLYLIHLSYSTAIFHEYLRCLYTISQRFSAYINNIYMVCSTIISGISISSSTPSLNTLFTDCHKWYMSRFFKQHYFIVLLILYLFIYLFVFFIFGFYFLISAFIELTYIVGAQLVIPIWMTTNEANTEKETELVTAKVKISKCLT